MARFGDSSRKSREAYIQHNGWFVGNVKFVISRFSMAASRLPLVGGR